MKLGEKQTLTVVKQVDFGVYLAEQPEDETRVLLPAKQVPEGTKLHDKLEVFLYKDSKDRLIATTNEPKLTLGARSTKSATGHQNRCIPGLGTGKRSAASF